MRSTTRPIAGNEITLPPPAPHRQVRGQRCHLRVAQLEGRHVGARPLLGGIAKPPLKVRDRVLRADVRQVGTDGCPHPPDGVAAVAPVAHEVLLALLGGLLRDQSTDRRQPQQQREGYDTQHHCLSPAFGCRTVSTGHRARRITRSVTLPSRARFSPLRPCVPITIMPAPSSSAVLTISS